MTRDDAIEIVYEAMDNIQDMDTTLHMYARAAVDALTAAQEWQDISTAPNDSDFRWYGLHVQHRSGHSWFEAHYVQHDDDGEMRSPSGDNFSDWAFSDFEVWCNAPPPPVAVIAEERTDG